MKITILKARINRSNLEEYAGDYFRSETSPIVTALNANDKQALVGIEREDGVYTILGKSSVYYSTESGINGEISLNVFSSILSANGIDKGKRSDFEYVKINEEGQFVWMHDKATMEALWNIILWLEGLI